MHENKNTILEYLSVTTLILRFMLRYHPSLEKELKSSKWSRQEQLKHGHNLNHN